MAAAPDPFASIAGLTDEDRALIARAAQRVVMSTAPAGSKASWYNPHDNNGGEIVVLTAGACRVARYDMTLASRNSTHSYKLTWCHQPDGSWTPKG